MTAQEQAVLRTRILEVINDVLVLEHSPFQVGEVRLVPGPSFFGLSFGTSMLLPGGGIAVRVAVGRPLPEIADTVLHETAHVILGRMHIANPDHGRLFQETYNRLKTAYFKWVIQRLEVG